VVLLEGSAASTSQTTQAQQSCVVFFLGLYLKEALQKCENIPKTKYGSVSFIKKKENVRKLCRVALISWLLEMSDKYQVSSAKEP